MDTFAAAPLRNTARAFTARGRWFSDGPDFVDVACSHCKHLVESVDSRGECDDCAADALRAEAREVAAIDQRTALVVGAFAFARRAAAQLVADLAGDEGFSSWLDARQADAAEMQAAEHDAADLGARRAA